MNNFRFCPHGLETTNTLISFHIDHDSCSQNRLSDLWFETEKRVLSAGRKVILVIDDESRKYEDLFFTLTQEFHVVYAYDAKDALSKLSAMNVDLAVVDIQIGSGKIWTAQETNDFKKTGLKILDELKRIYPKTKRVILTGIKYDLQELNQDLYHAFLRKPIDPDKLYEELTKIIA